MKIALRSKSAQRIDEKQRATFVNGISALLIAGQEDFHFESPL
jgi:hypothetical protein